ncbi:hypothetical protein OH77DRAFT_13978 [Trametes cingulata]|nr:hypothetical protein OH77DRAFT_13978 [Trametes cingulata]
MASSSVSVYLPAFGAALLIQFALEQTQTWTFLSANRPRLILPRPWACVGLHRFSTLPSAALLRCNCSRVTTS